MNEQVKGLKPVIGYNTINAKCYKHMTLENFAYWLRGFFEIQNPTTLNEEQVKVIKEHLDKFFQDVELNKLEFREPYLSC